MCVLAAVDGSIDTHKKKTKRKNEHNEQPHVFSIVPFIFQCTTKRVGCKQKRMSLHRTPNKEENKMGAAIAIRRASRAMPCLFVDLLLIVLSAENGSWQMRGKR